MATASVLGVFAHVDTTLQAIRDLRAKGFSDLTVYTPVPVEEIEHEVEKVRPLSAVRLFTLVGRAHRHRHRVLPHDLDLAQVGAASPAARPRCRSRLSSSSPSS